jgi:hypothetical protein
MSDTIMLGGIGRKIDQARLEANAGFDLLIKLMAEQNALLRELLAKP